MGRPVKERSGRFLENASERFPRVNAHGHAGIAWIFAREILFPLRLGRGEDARVIHLERLP